MCYNVFMTRRLEGGYGHWVVLIIGIILILMLIGFFKSGSQNTIANVTYKAVLRLPCGLTMKGPHDNDKISFPLKVYGYVNGCGWETRGGSAGTAQVFDGNGTRLSDPMTLIVPPDSTGMPYYFEGNIKLLVPPQSDTGSLVIHGVTGFSHAISIRF
jgi:hypothetical protein